MFTVAPNCQIIEQLDLKDSSYKLVAICAISYFLSLYLIFYAGVQTFDMTWCKIFLHRSKHAHILSNMLALASGLYIYGQITSPYPKTGQS